MIYIGTAGWGYDFWSLYPAGTVNKLAVYAEHSSLTEINSTFYRLPSEQTVANWYASVPEDFMFSAKLLHEITHQEDSYYLNKGKVVEYFQAIAVLREKHKFTLLQFPYSFQLNDENKHFLLDLLDFTLNFHDRLIVEFRHPSWNTKEILDYLSRKQILQCDSLNGIRRNLPQSNMYLRMLGNHKLLPEDALGREKLDKSKEIEQLAEWIATVRDMENYYIFFGNEYSGDPVRDARELHKQLLNRDIVAQGFQPEISLLDFI